MPALDGVRALAVALVMAYHGGIPAFRVAGFYGVGDRSRQLVSFVGPVGIEPTTKGL